MIDLDVFLSRIFFGNDDSSMELQTARLQIETFLLKSDKHCRRCCVSDRRRRQSLSDIVVALNLVGYLMETSRECVVWRGNRRPKRSGNVESSLQLRHLHPQLCDDLFVLRNVLFDRESISCDLMGNVSRSRGVLQSVVCLLIEEDTRGDVRNHDSSCVSTERVFQQSRQL